MLSAKSYKMKISKYISLIEITHSNTAVSNDIDNTPSPIQLALIKECARMVFDPLREAAGGPIKINSGFRSTALNKKLKGSSGSQHTAGCDSNFSSYGFAIDIDDNYFYNGLSQMDNIQMFHYIKDNLIFDQLIWEFGDLINPKWIHFSYRPDDNNRGEVLVAKKNSKGKTYYVPFKE